MKKQGSKTSAQLENSHHSPNFTRPVKQPGQLPNYMKSTTTSDARRTRLKVSTKRRGPRTSPDKTSLHRKDSTNSTNVCLISRQERALVRKGTSDTLCGNLEVARPTCSSTLKDHEFPDYPETGLNGNSGVKICPYSYCSFSGHVRAVFPLLKCFVSARRRELRAKRRCQTPKARPAGEGTEIIGREEPAASNGDQTRYFDEIYGDEVSQESYDEEGSNTDSLITGDNWDSVGLRKSLPNENIGNQASGPVEETTASVDGTKCKAIKHDKDRVENECNRAENFNGAGTKDLANELYPGDSELKSVEAECIVVHELNSKNTAMPETEDENSTRARATVKCGKSNQEPDDLRHFNPSGLHFLPLEPDRKAENVNLRHQELDARKNAEEWMVDYALRQAVTKGGTSSHRKVALLVEAFERVLPTSKH